MSAEFEPLIVTAHMANGFVSHNPWSPDLAGILAYWWLKERLSEDEFAAGMAGATELVDADLPLQRESFGPDWWWQCSSPIFTVRETTTRYVNRRFDDHKAYGRVPETVRKVLTAGGPYKAYHTPHTVQLVDRITWHCIGDASEIQRLLRYCSNIGYGHTKGMGQVREWLVTPDPDLDSELAIYHRPLPVAYAEEVGATGPRMMHGIRPPARLTKTLCVMPDPIEVVHAD